MCLLASVNEQDEEIKTTNHLLVLKNELNLNEHCLKTFKNVPLLPIIQSRWVELCWVWSENILTTAATSSKQKCQTRTDNYRSTHPSVQLWQVNNSYDSDFEGWYQLCSNKSDATCELAVIILWKSAFVFSGEGDTKPLHWKTSLASDDGRWIICDFLLKILQEQVPTAPLCHC